MVLKSQARGRGAGGWSGGWRGGGEEYLGGLGSKEWGIRSRNCTGLGACAQGAVRERGRVEAGEGECVGVVVVMILVVILLLLLVLLILLVLLPPLTTSNTMTERVEAGRVRVSVRLSACFMFT